jgi:hypothetical protein
MSHYPDLTNARCFALSLLPIALLVAPSAQAADETDKAASSTNYIIIGATGVDVDGSETAYRAHTNYSSDFRGGVERMHYEKQLDRGWFFEMDGRAIFDESEYDVKVVFEKYGFNRTTLTFQNYRYWSDARTVDMPGVPDLKPFDPSLYLDRSKFGIESTFFLDDSLDLTFRYTYRERDGEKASTHWSDHNYPGGYTTPAFLEIDEEHHTVEVEAEKRWTDSSLGGGLRWDHIEIENARNFVRGYDDPGAERYYTQIDEEESNDVTGNVISEHRFSEKLMVNLSGLYTRLEGDFGGSRIVDDMFYGSYVSGIQNYANPQFRDHGFVNLDGNYDLDQWVATLAALWQPAEHWAVTPSIRVETRSQDASASETETNIPDGGAVIATEADLASWSQVDQDSVAAEIGARYTGLTNWTFYGDAYVSTEGGDHIEEQIDITDPLNPDVDRDTNFDRDAYKLKLGANWYAHPKATVAFNISYKNEETDYDHASLDADGYPGFIEWQERESLKASVRLNWRILPNLTSVSRVDYMEQQINSKGFGLPSVQSSDRERWSFSQNLSFQPTQRLTLIGSLNYVCDELSTAVSDFYEDRDTALVADNENDYVFADLTGIYFHSETLEFNGSIGGLVSNNGYDNSAISVPYGSDFAQYHGKVGLSKRLAPNKKVTLQYGYYDYEDDMLDDADFSAHILSAKYEYRF